MNLHSGWLRIIKYFKICLGFEKIFETNLLFKTLKNVKMYILNSNHFKLFSCKLLTAVILQIDTYM